MGFDGNTLVDIAATIVHETDKAYLLHSLETDTEAWFPKSLTEDNGDNTFTCPVWLAEDKEFI